MASIVDNEIVTILVSSGDAESVQVLVTEIIEHVTIIVSSAPGEGGVGGGQINKLMHTATGFEAGVFTILGSALAGWSQVTLGETPLEEVASNPGSLQYCRSGDDFILGGNPEAGEKILFEWQ